MRWSRSSFDPFPILIFRYVSTWKLVRKTGQQPRTISGMYLYQCSDRLSWSEWNGPKQNLVLYPWHCDRCEALTCLWSIQSWILMLWATLASLIICPHSLISWSYGLNKLQIRPFFHCLTLGCVLRVDDLNVISAHSWSEKCVTKLLKHRLWASLIVFEVMARDFE